MYKPEGKISRKEISELLSVHPNQIIRYEEYGFLPKGEKIKGTGSNVWYEYKDFVELKRHLKMKKD